MSRRAVRLALFKPDLDMQVNTTAGISTSRSVTTCTYSQPQVKVTPCHPWIMAHEKKKIYSLWEVEQKYPSFIRHLRTLSVSSLLFQDDDELLILHRRLLLVIISFCRLYKMPQSAISAPSPCYLWKVCLTVPPWQDWFALERSVRYDMSMGMCLIPFDFYVGDNKGVLRLSAGCLHSTCHTRQWLRVCRTCVPAGWKRQWCREADHPRLRLWVHQQLDSPRWLSGFCPYTNFPYVTWASNQPWNYKPPSVVPIHTAASLG
jgi:hypothetical protein